MLPIWRGTDGSNPSPSSGESRKLSPCLRRTLGATASRLPRLGISGILRWSYLQGYVLAHALDNEGTAGRIVEASGQDFLVFGGIVPALERRFVSEFKNDDAFGLRPAFDQFGGSCPRQEAAAILLDRGADRRPVGLHRGRVGDLQFDDEIGGYGGLPW